MPNILILSKNELFLADLSDQIQHYSSDYTLTGKSSICLADIIIVDEDEETLSWVSKQEIKAPIIFLGKKEIKETSGVKIIEKPISLLCFLNELNSCINLFSNSKSGHLSFNNYIVMPMNKEIINKRNNEVTKLTEKEVAILKYLYKNKDRLISKNELLQEVWGYAPDVSTHTIETHIYRLRQKVEKDNEDAQLILTVEGGYQLKV